MYTQMQSRQVRAEPRTGLALKLYKVCEEINQLAEPGPGGHDVTGMHIAHDLRVGTVPRNHLSSTPSPQKETEYLLRDLAKTRHQARGGSEHRPQPHLSSSPLGLLLQGHRPAKKESKTKSQLNEQQIFTFSDLMVDCGSLFCFNTFSVVCVCVPLWEGRVRL